MEKQDSEGRMKTDVPAGVDVVADVSVGESAKSKKKTNVLAIVLGMTTVVFAGLAVFFGTHYFMDNNGGGSGMDESDASVISRETTEAPEEVVQVVSSTMAEDYDEVKNEIKKITEGIANKWDYIENDDRMMYKPEGLNTYVPMKLNLMMQINRDTSGEVSQIDLRGNFEEAGYTAIGDLPFMGSSGPRIDGYLNADKNIICGSYNDNDGTNYYVLVECAKTDWTWLNEETTKLVSDLETAYRNKTGEYPITMYGLYNEIKDSEYKPYQTLQVAIGGGYALFYRVSPDAEWQYFAGGQSPLSCDDYNTEDVKKAFAGDVCYDGLIENTVQP